MNSNQSLRTQIIEILSAEVGILAEVIFDEVLAELGIHESRLSPHMAGIFVRVLNKKLPGDLTNRQLVIRDVGQLLMNARSKT